MPISIPMQWAIAAMAALLAVSLAMSRAIARDAADLTNGLGARKQGRISLFFEDTALRSGWKLTGAELAAIWFAACGTAAAVLLLQRAPLPLVVAGTASAAAAVYALASVAARRTAKDFESQFGDAMPMIAADIKSGGTIISALQAVAASVDNPLKGHLDRVVTRVEGGQPVEEALDEMARATKSMDVKIFAMAVAVQQHHGGSISAIISQIGDTVNDRRELRKLIKARSAAMTSTVRIISGAVGIFIIGFSLVMETARAFYTTPIGLGTALVIGLMVLLANLLAKKLRESIL